MNCGEDEIGKEGRGCERLSVPHQKLKSLFLDQGSATFSLKGQIGNISSFQALRSLFQLLNSDLVAKRAAIGKYVNARA